MHSMLMHKCLASYWLALAPFCELTGISRSEVADWEPFCSSLAIEFTRA